MRDWSIQIQTYHSLHMTFISVLEGEIASLNGVLKVENYHIACYLSTD